MPRWHVNVVQMRARDIKVGDVVAKDPSRFDGWFRVHDVRQLGDGTFNLLDKANTLSFTAGPFDLVGLQTPVPLPAEAERNVRREEESHGSSQATTGPATTPETPQGAAREAAARESASQGQAGGEARALPGP